jgi:alpha-glucosidase (family GH31 glycosyl hydrolase)
MSGVRFPFFHLLILSFFMAVSPLKAEEVLDPVADPAAVITSGNARFTVLTSRMIRIQYSSTAQFEDRATFAIVNRRLPVPQFTTETADGYLYIRTEDVTLRYKVGSVIKATDKKPDNLMVSFQMNGRNCIWYPGKDDSMNLLGTNRTLDQAWGDNKRGNLEKGLLSRAGWSIIDESPTTLRGDGSASYAFEPKEEGITWWANHIDKTAIDWYFLGYGHDYKGCLGDYIKVGGRVPMPPKYILGYWYSRYWAYTQNEFMQIVRDAENNDVPMDVLIMDMDWHKSGWTGWSWNTSRIPQPRTLINYIHNHGLKTALNLHPSDGVSSKEDNYKAMAADLGDTSGQTLLWKVEDYDYMKAFFKDIIRPHEKEGVDFWWLDWQQALTVGKHGQEKNYTPAVGSENLGETFWCNHTFFEDMQKNRPDLRPVIYHRWGGLGSHRYPICFSGDTWAAWSMLGYEIFFTSNASNVLYDYWGHDLGGHQGGNNDPELLLRWLQFGAYTPIFRTHATNDSKLERRIWKYSNFTQLREAIRLRYRLFPYLYTAARETYDTGIGMNRPLYYDYPEDANSYIYEDEYMFGNDMLVAPIYSPQENGRSCRMIWLPDDKWWDVTRSHLVNGKQAFYSSYTLDEFPVFYRAGSIIPFYPVRRTVVGDPGEIILKVVPGANGTGRFYEDKGDNQDYKGDAWAMTTFTQNRTDSSVTLTIGGRQGSFEGMPTDRKWTVQFLGTPASFIAEGITIDGEPVEDSAVQYDAETGTLTITISTTNLAAPITITVPLSEMA